MEKKFKALIILHWKTGKFRIVKKKPKDLTPFEIAVDFELDVIMPELPTVLAKGKVELSEQKIKEMTVNAI